MKNKNKEIENVIENKMRMPIKTTIIALSLFFTISVYAEVIQLKNGNKIRGAVIKKTNEGIYLSTLDGKGKSFIRNEDIEGIELEEVGIKAKKTETKKGKLSESEDFKIFMEKFKSTEDYKKKLKSASEIILIIKDLFLYACNLYSEGWKIAIESRLDFNAIFTKVHAELESNGSIGKMNDYKLTLEMIMKELVDPPPEYDECYKKIVELYGICSQIHSLAISPSGSLLSYNNSINDLDINFIKIKNELEIMLGN